MDKNELNIIKKIRSGDKAVFKILFENYYQRLFLYAISYVGDNAAAEDIVQDLFLHLWEKRESVDNITSLSSYFFRAVHNRCIQYLRHEKVTLKYAEKHRLKLKEAEILYHSSGSFSFTEIDLDEIQFIIENTRKNLPEKTREIFDRSRENFFGNKEIAKEMNINIKTVEYHISKALQLFREALSDYLL